MKKHLSLLLALILIFSFCSCKKNYDPNDITDIKITFCSDYEQYENKTGNTVSISSDKAETIASLAEKITENGKSTTKPMDMPRYEISFISGGKEHTIYVDYQNTFAATFLERGNYFCLSDYDYYSEIYSIYKEAAYAEQDKEPALTEPLEEDSSSPYLSISYRRACADNPEEKETVIACYDINTKTLSEICVLPDEINAVSPKYSRANNAIYYFYTGIWQYDLSSGETTRLDNANYSYNELQIIDENTLLLMAIPHHAIVPMYFDIENQNFLLIDDGYNAPTVYTSGATSLSYNPITDDLTYIRWIEDEAYSDEYLSEEKSIERYLTVVHNGNGMKFSEKIFTYSAKINEPALWYAAQLSENEFIVVLYNEFGSSEPEYYSLIFGEETTFTKTEQPCPAISNMSGLCSHDGGKTFFFYHRGGKPGAASGIYSYSVENDELNLILAAPEESVYDYMSLSLIEDGSVLTE